MGAAAALDLGDGLVDRPGRLVGALVGERVEDVGDGDDPADQRDPLPHDSARVAGAVPALVVVERDLLRHLQDGEGALAEDLGAHLGVLLHHLPLGGGQLARLEEDLVGDADLADVVQRRGAPEQRGLVLAEAEAAGDQRGGPANALGVLVGGVVAVLGGDGEPLERLEAGFLERLGPLPHGPLEDVTLVLQRLLGLLLSRDVARRHVEPLLLVDGPDAPLEPAVLAVGAAESVAEDGARCTFDHERDLSLGPHPIVGMDEGVHGPCAELRRRSNPRVSSQAGFSSSKQPAKLAVPKRSSESAKWLSTLASSSRLPSTNRPSSPPTTMKATTWAGDAEGADDLVGRDVGAGRQAEGEGRRRQPAAEAELHRADGDRDDEEDEHRVGALPRRRCGERRSRRRGPRRARRSASPGSADPSIDGGAARAQPPMSVLAAV